MKTQELLFEGRGGRHLGPLLRSAIGVWNAIEVTGSKLRPSTLVDRPDLRHVPPSVRIQDFIGLLLMEI